MNPALILCLLLYSDASFRWIGVPSPDGQYWMAVPFAIVCWWVVDQRDHSTTYAYMIVPLSYFRHFSAHEQTYIAQVEMVALVSALYSRPDLFAGRHVIAHIDTATALSAVINGYSSRPEMAQLVNLYHVARAALRSVFWSAYVASKANLADIPTRMERESEIPAGIPQSEFVLAPLDWDAFTRWWSGRWSSWSARRRWRARRARRARRRARAEARARRRRRRGTRARARM